MNLLYKKENVINEKKFFFVYLTIEFRHMYVYGFQL